MAKGKKTGGRRPGSQNKATRAFKEMVVKCLGDIGGSKALAEWARENRTEFYKIAARLIPTEVSGAGEGMAPLQIELTHRRAAAPNAE
jgi:hypothetical protein